MVVHRCDNCKFPFDNKTAKNRHEESKKECVKDMYIDMQPEGHPCEFCGEVKCRKDVLENHWDICKKNPKNIEARKALKALKASQKKQKIKKVNNVRELVILTPYSKTFNMRFFPDSYISQIFDSNDNAYLACFKLFHCNQNNRQQHNIRYINDTTLSVFCQNGEWHSKKIMEMIDIIIHGFYNGFVDYLHEEKHRLSGRYVGKIEKAINLVSVDKNTRMDDTQFVEFCRIRKTILDALYHNRQMHEDTFLLSGGIRPNQIPKAKSMQFILDVDSFCTESDDFESVDGSPDKKKKVYKQVESGTSSKSYEDTTSSKKKVSKQVVYDTSSESFEEKPSSKKKKVSKQVEYDTYESVEEKPTRKKKVSKQVESDTSSESVEEKPTRKKKVSKQVKSDTYSESVDEKPSTKKKYPRTLTDKHKKYIASRQSFQCANKPGKKLRGLKGWSCPKWEKTDDSRGCFGEDGHQIDHIVEFCLTHDDSYENLQALCTSCHATKTRRFNLTRK